MKISVKLLARYLFFTVLILSFLACKNKPNHVINKNKSLEQLINSLKNADNDSIIVVAHRGDWRNAPENSLQAIQNAIDMGVDVVEIDVRLSNDSVPILMHDKTLNRTTNGKGKVSDWTLDSLKGLHLKNGLGRPTFHEIPTLKEALTLAKGKILINLDKSYNYFDLIYPMLEETGTTQQIVFKGSVSFDKLKKDYGKYLDKILFVPIINLNKSYAIERTNEYLNHLQPVAFEFVFSGKVPQYITKFDSIRKLGSRVWVNSLWASLNAGYEDDKAVKFTDSIYGWYIKNNINMMQTDRPQLLLDYLREKGLHQ